MIEYQRLVYRKNETTYMKLFLRFTILVLIIYPSVSFSLDRKTCSSMISGAKTEFGAKLMFGSCLREKGNFFNRGKRFKCAKKAMREDTEFAAKVMFKECMK